MEGKGYFKGMAALGAVPMRGTFGVYCCDRFGFEPGRGHFAASFTLYEAVAPMDGDEAYDRLREHADNLVDCSDAAWRLEMCERWDCPPSELAARLCDAMLDDACGDPFAALADEEEMRPLSEGEVGLRCAAGGQHDEFGSLGSLFADASLVSEVERLWGLHHLMGPDAVPEADLAAIEDVAGRLAASCPSPEAAAAAYVASGDFGGWPGR